MPKYKISKKNLKEFFGFFGKKKKPAEIQKVIDNDPRLQKIDKEIEKIHSQYKMSPEMVDLLKKYGAL